MKHSTRLTTASQHLMNPVADKVESSEESGRKRKESKAIVQRKKRQIGGKKLRLVGRWWYSTDVLVLPPPGEYLNKGILCSLVFFCRVKESMFAHERRSFAPCSSSLLPLTQKNNIPWGSGYLGIPQLRPQAGQAYDFIWGDCVYGKTSLLFKVGSIKSGVRLVKSPL